MKTLSMLIAGAVLAVAVAGQVQAATDCAAGNDRGRCKMLPAPPPPPAAPAVLAPPPPLPPAPPVPPAPLQVPESAHAACAGKAAGTALTLTPRTGVTMSGSCEKDSRGMYFDVQSIQDRS